MKLILSIILFNLLIISTYSQKTTYGVVLGWNNYNIEINAVSYHNLISGTGKSSLNYGGYFDYQLNNSFGLKTNLFFNNTKEGTYYDTDYRLSKNIEFNSFQVLTYLKYDVDQAYNKGVYLLTGFRHKIITKKSDDLLKTNSSGVLFGFGVNFLKNLSLEIIGDYGITNTIKLENKSHEIIGGYINLTYNLRTIFTKQ